MKKFVEKWLGREKTDIRQKIEAKRQQIMRKLRRHQKIIKKVKQIQEKSEKDASFLPHLEEAIEKNRILRIMNYKDHISKILETKMNNY
jgi:DNA repair exonuclease SbcCD ATPase subunit